MDGRWTSSYGEDRGHNHAMNALYSSRYDRQDTQIPSDVLYDYDQQRRQGPHSAANGLMQPQVADRMMLTEEGRARLSLGPLSTLRHAHQFSHPQPTRPTASIQLVQNYAQEPVRLSPSQFAYQDAEAYQDVEPPQQAMSSSPTFRAIQRLRRSNAPMLDHSHLHRHLVPPGDAGDAAMAADFEPESPRVVHGRSLNLSHAPRRLVQGIEILSTRELPDRFRAIFPYPCFNAIQSKCFATAFGSNDNLVLSSPTGSGKTVVLELAICRAICGFPSGQFKIVYQAPIKALCSERRRDWEAKFRHLGLVCAELTGDTDMSDLRSVHQADIIITTPEKWDSMTRKWKDHEKLMRLVKLFLIDEVHILKEDRGATLEAIVSRMNSIGSQVRFVALSATVPNSEDIASWLGKDPTNRDIPAVRERFGEEFRPVKLQKHVCGYPSNSNDFQFDKILDNKLSDVIAKYSHRKPIMVFCATRKATEITAKLLAQWWASQRPQGRYWEAPRQELRVIDRELQGCVSSAVAYHHAGLDLTDRQKIENAFLHGDVNVICCTSTLAVGVNLPCHFVIIKNTVKWTSEGLKEYPDLEVMQMLGRAGRPQFDNDAVAVIMTRQEKARHYEKMVSGQEVLESRLHLNLIDHLNAEIGLGTITDVYTARRWLNGTFLYVRLKQNPDHYRLEGDIGGRNLDERLDQICRQGIDQLQEYQLVTDEEKIKATEFGDAMARYYVNFETMKNFLTLGERAKVSDILTVLALAAEFKDLRFRAGEKTIYKKINSNPSIKYPVVVNLDLPAHKVSLIVQSVLNGVDFPDDAENKHKAQNSTDIHVIFQHASRLIRCIIDCQIHLEDSVAARNALTLARSLGARVWDDSPLQLKQVEGVGVATVRKFVMANIKTIEDLEFVDAHRIEAVLSRNPPFGAKLLDKVRGFPKLRVKLTVHGEPVSIPGTGVRVNLRAEIGFLNDKPPLLFGRKPVNVIFLAETSDGHLARFCRASAKKIDKGQEILFHAILTSAAQSVSCYVMCDEIAGTMRDAHVHPKAAASLFPQSGKGEERVRKPRKHSKGDDKVDMNTSRRRTSQGVSDSTSRNKNDFDFEDGDLDDADLIGAEGQAMEYHDIDEFDDGSPVPTQRGKSTNDKAKSAQKKPEQAPVDEDWAPTRLPNGNWQCNHICRTKGTCHHLCCREGMTRPPKPPVAKKKKATAAEEAWGPQPQRKGVEEGKTSKTQTKLNVDQNQRKPLNAPVCSPKSPIAQIVDFDGREIGQTKVSSFMSKITQSHAHDRSEPKDVQRLHDLHAKAQKRAPPASMTSIARKKPKFEYAGDAEVELSFLPKQMERVESDYGDEDMMDLEIPATLEKDGHVESGRARRHVALDDGDGGSFDDEDSLFDEALIGLVDSRVLAAADGTKRSKATSFSSAKELYRAQGDESPRDTVQAMDKTEKQARPKEKAIFVTGFSSSSTTEQQFGGSTRPGRPLLGTENTDRASSKKFWSKGAASIHDDATRNPSADNSTRLVAAAENEDADDAKAVVEGQARDNVPPPAADSADDWFEREFGGIVEVV